MLHDPLIYIIAPAAPAAGGFGAAPGGLFGAGKSNF